MTLREIVEGPVTTLGNGVIGVLFAVAFLLFIYGMFKYFFLKSSDPKAREDGKAFIFWGIIGLAVMFSVWGLVNTVISIIPT